jgi:hypothetical protein
MSSHPLPRAETPHDGAREAAGVPLCVGGTLTTRLKFVPVVHPREREAYAEQALRDAGFPLMKARRVVRQMGRR